MGAPDPLRAGGVLATGSLSPAAARPRAWAGPHRPWGSEKTPGRGWRRGRGGGRGRAGQY